MEYPYLSLIAGPNRNITSSFHKELNPIVYDPFTQMKKSITVSGSLNKTMSFNYSVDNERVLKTESSGTTKNSNLYIRGNNNYPITEKINLTSVLNDKIYIYGPTGLIAFKDATATYYVIKDHLGSTRVLFRNTGSYYTTYDYSPFGSLMRATINGDVDYRFTGQEFDSETALYNFRARLYDDELGIFYAVDPSGQNFAPFSYAGNNPIIFVDKDGRWFIIDDLFVAVTSFVYGYFSHAISTGEWGGQALTSGAISAGVSWLAYNTGGAVAGLFFDATTSSAGYSIVSSAVGSAVGGFTGSTINQLRYEGSVDWNQSLRSGIAGLGGGLIGGASEFYSSSLIDKFPFEHTMSHFIRSSGYQIGSNLILGNHPFENFDAGWGSAALPFWLDVGEIGANLFIKLEYARRADENGVIGGVTDVFGEKIGYGIAQDLWGKFNLGIDWEGIHLFEIFGPAGLGVGTASDQLIATSYVNIDLGFRLAGSSTGFNSLFHRSTLNNYWLYYQNYWR
ncbi:MAG: RHS repeat-associated core domain-containing protein [Ignavibacteriota bacterium]|nr:RHS repeat-associated core domain-containing protein [Ignavibacteriota bacterium]MCO6447224.1 RHS repeat-associated core domain-containing protein [Ignavibacterium album]MCZ2269380.1 RHS repeat-associated core domain-containing protein [Ignavibacteriales bacterium]QKJ99548.1 MAG: RHS repeat-associated core domain-containing protein [Ignavibacteriota bacterium]HOJ08630.1 RHS repeat-associated core domain-containing protein [Ignavibacteriaceae bacterium]